MRLPSRLLRIAAASALLLGFGAVGGGAAVAGNVLPDDYFVTPSHGWVDPTFAYPNGRPAISFDFHFPIPTAHWVSHGTAPKFTDGVTHCGISNHDFGSTVECQGIGNPVPGDYSIGFEVKVEGGGGFDFGNTAAFTVCPLTGCSDLFDLAVTPAASTICAGADLSALGPFTYDFNVPWNASNAAFGALPGATVTSDFPTDGAAFTLAGTIAKPGEYTLPVTVTDEFGGDHAASVPITVLAGTGGCPQLANTGVDVEAPLAAALALAAAGIALLAARRLIRRPL